MVYQGQLMIIAQARSMTPVSLSVEVGGLFPLTITNSGRVLLARMSVEVRDQVLETSDDFQKMTEKKKQELLKELKALGKVDISVRDSELTEGVTDFAVPVLDAKSQVLAVLAVSTLTSQIRKTVSHKTIHKEMSRIVIEIRRTLGIENL